MRKFSSQTIAASLVPNTITIRKTDGPSPVPRSVLKSPCSPMPHHFQSWLDYEHIDGLPPCLKFLGTKIITYYRHTSYYCLVLRFLGTLWYMVSVFVILPGILLLKVYFLVKVKAFTEASWNVFLFSFCCCDLTHYPKQHRGGKGSFGLYSQVTVYH